jgi:hypothetical protein
LTLFLVFCIIERIPGEISLKETRKSGMIFLNAPSFKKYLLPGLVFQSVVIAGGYGTGRELADLLEVCWECS